MRKLFFLFVAIVLNVTTVFANYGHTAGWPGNEESSPRDEFFTQILGYGILAVAGFFIIKAVVKRFSK